PQSAIATPPAATNARRCIVLAPPRGAVYIMRPRQTLEGAVVDALRSPNRAARRQASQGQLSLGSRDRHSLRRMQGDGEGHELQRDRRSRGQRRLLRRDRRRQRLLAWRWFLDVPPCPNVEASA